MISAAINSNGSDDDAKELWLQEEARGRGASAICCILPLLDYLVWAGVFFRTIMAAMIYSDDRDNYMIIIMILSSDDDDDTAKS